MFKLIKNLFLFLIAVSCKTKPVNEFTLQQKRDQFIDEKTHFIDSVFAETPDSTNEKDFTGAFWASELMLRKSPQNEAVLQKAFTNYSTFSNSFKRSLIQHIYSLYPAEFIAPANTLLTSENDVKLFAMLAEYVLRADNAQSGFVFELLHQKFPGADSIAILQGLMLNHSDYEPVSPQQLDDLFRFREKSGEATIYVIASPNRDLPGYAMIQKADGHFVKTDNDTLKVQLLARSITNLPGYLTNGNSPTGVFSMQSVATSDNVFIGPSPTLVTVLPFESNPSDFSFGKIKTENWTMADYNSFFPESWKYTTQKNMAYYAGKAGRSEIIMHGTAIDEEFYKNQPYYPFTPSLGCLCTLERWDRNSGTLTESGQCTLVSALKENAIEKAMVYVVQK